MKIFGEQGDRVSSHDMDFDWADEQIHTHYGTHWLKHFLQQQGDSRKPINFRKQSEACIARMREAATAQDRADVLAALEKMMSKAYALASCNQ